MAKRGSRTTSVTLQRTPCYGMCPVYTVTVNHHGRFEWVGQQFVPVKGDHVGDFPTQRFEDLARLIEDLGFFSWERSYSTLITDAASTIITVERGGASTSVEQYGTDEPAGLQLLATFIDGIVAPALWEVEWTAGTSR